METWPGGSHQSAPLLALGSRWPEHLGAVCTCLWSQGWAVLVPGLGAAAQGSAWPSWFLKGDHDALTKQKDSQLEVLAWGK